MKVFVISTYDDAYNSEDKSIMGVYNDKKTALKAQKDTRHKHE